MRLLFTGRAPSRGLALALRERNGRIACAFGLDPDGHGAYLLVIVATNARAETATVVAGGDDLGQIAAAGVLVSDQLPPGHLAGVTSAADTLWDVLDLRS